MPSRWGLEYTDCIPFASKTPPTKKFLVYDSNLHLTVGLLFKGSEECGASIITITSRYILTGDSFKNYSNSIGILKTCNCVKMSCIQ